MLSSQLPGVISVSSFELSYPYSGNLIFLILSASQFDPLHFFRDDYLENFYKMHFSYDYCQTAIYAEIRFLRSLSLDFIEMSLIT